LINLNHCGVVDKYSDSLPHPPMSMDSDQMDYSQKFPVGGRLPLLLRGKHLYREVVAKLVIDQTGVRRKLIKPVFLSRGHFRGIQVINVQSDTPQGSSRSVSKALVC
jgi:hypothetical protein